MKKTMKLFALLLISASLLAGCSEAPAGNNEPNTPPPADETPVSEAENETDPAWPRTYVDALGNEVIIESKPEKVVSTFHAMFPDYFYSFDIHPLAVAAAESRFHHLSAYQEFLSVSKPEDIGPANALNFEKILSLAPDLIVMTKLQEEVYPQLSQIAPTITMDHAQINTDWKYGVNEFAKIFGEEDKVDEIINSVEKTIADGAESLAQFRDKNETVIFLAVTGKQLFPYPVAQLQTVYNDVDKGGLGLIAPEAYNNLDDYSQPLSLETVAADYKPDHLFIIADNVDGDAAEYINQLEETTVWKNMDAVKNNHVYKIDRSIFGFNAPIGTKFGVNFVVDSLSE